MVAIRKLHVNTYRYGIVLIVFLTVVWAVFPGEGIAVPAFRGLVKLTQADGATFQARLWGDEWGHGMETEDGYTILYEEASKNWTYAIHSEEGDLIKSSHIVTRDSFPNGCTPHMRPIGKARARILQRKKNRTAPTAEQKLPE